MHYPFKFIESRYSKRDEFHMTDGHQPTHALFYLKKGSFVIQINNKKETVTAGDCYILPDYVHHHRNVLEPIEFVYVKFRENPACPYTLDIPFGKAIFKDANRFDSNITALEKLLPNDDFLSAAMREHLLMDILFQLCFESNPEQVSYENQACRDGLVGSAVSYIDKHLTEKILIEEVCRNTGTNASTLNFKFRREFNMSIGQYITDRRIKNACRLLISTSYSISEIALRCGFSDVYYFSNTFRKIQGISPSEYRK